METEILELLDRNPLTVDDTAASLQLPRMEAARHLDNLHRRGLVKRRRAGNRIFYYPTGEEPVLTG
jgi:predicted ArsR family transcriptional regulator